MTPTKPSKAKAKTVTAADVLRALARDPAASEASRQWAERLLRGDQDESKPPPAAPK